MRRYLARRRARRNWVGDRRVLNHLADRGVFYEADRLLAEDDAGIIRETLTFDEFIEAMDEAVRLTNDDVASEGFEGWTVETFIAFFCASHKGITPESEITRIEWRYTS